MVGSPLLHLKRLVVIGLCSPLISGATLRARILRLPKRRPCRAAWYGERSRRPRRLAAPHNPNADEPRPPPVPPRPPRSGEHPPPARGGRRVPQPGAAVLGGQGQLGAAAPAAQGLRPREAADPAAARGHALEVPRDDRLPRPPRGGD